MLNSKIVISESGIAFGTSGARGLVTQFTPDVCAAFTHAFSRAMQTSFSFTQIAIAIDNRPSSYAMAQACSAALLQLGIQPIYYGVIPTPALAYKSMQDDMPAIMVTGSHIPFDRNGLKFYRPDGEITKADESAILNAKADFSALEVLPDIVTDNAATQLYIERYASLFSKDLLQGKHIGIYEHSSAGRDIYPELFRQLGAEVTSLERSDEFVPIDTEAVSEADKQKAIKWSEEYKFDAIFSTDGDGDRPLISDEKGQWLRGDILGLLCAKHLNIEALAIPVSCNTAIELTGYFAQVSRTRIGSPYVIAEFSELNNTYGRIAGFEANGGFLLGSDIELNGKTLNALPTRDALLPAFILLAAAQQQTISSLVAELPARITYSDRIQNFATEKSKQIITYGSEQPQTLLEQLEIKGVSVHATDLTDGLRMSLSDNSIVHLRPSGNAPELRCYAEASSLDKAKELAELALKNIPSVKL